MNILILTGLYPSSSALTSGIFIRDQALALAAAGHNVHVLHVQMQSLRGPVAQYRESWRIEHVQDEGVWVHRQSVPSPGLRPLVPKLFAWRARRLARDVVADFGRFDLIHAHFLIPAGVGGVALKERLGLPLVVTEHSTEYARGMAVGWRARAMRRVADHSDQLIAVSDALADLMEPVVGQRPAVVPNVVNVRAFAPRDAKSPLIERGLVVSVGALEHKKGYDVLLRALARLSQDWRAVVAGEGNKRKELVLLADSLGVADRVEFPGILSRGEIRRLLERAGVFVSSSRAETFGVAVAEALAAGVPVVTTRSGGPETLVEGTPLGLVTPCEPVELAAAIESVLAGDVPVPPTLGFKHVSARMSPEAVARQLATLYSGVPDVG